MSPWKSVNWGDFCWLMCVLLSTVCSGKCFSHWKVSHFWHHSIHQRLIVLYRLHLLCLVQKEQKVGKYNLSFKALTQCFVSATSKCIELIICFCLLTLINSLFNPSIVSWILDGSRHGLPITVAPWIPSKSIAIFIRISLFRIRRHNNTKACFFLVLPGWVFNHTQHRRVRQNIFNFFTFNFPQPFLI